MAADLAIIGGGPAGLFAALAAARHAPRWRVIWLRVAKPDFGPAYATRSDSHLLNVRAAQMSALVDEPDDFANWLSGVQGGDHAKTFAPRWRYGAYLQDRMSRLPATIETIDQPARAVRHGLFNWRIALAQNGIVRARRLVIAPGLAAPPDLGPLPLGVVGDVWDWWLKRQPDWRVPRDTETVRILGGGLTAVDMALGLRERGFTGRIDAVSRAGVWPHVHAEAPALRAADAALLAERLSACRSGAALVGQLRAAAAAGADWRTLMDSLRPHTNTIWTAMPESLRARLLRHGFAQWNRHRHRMAPEIAERLAADDKLTLRRGRALSDIHGVRINGQPAPPAALTLICTTVLGRDMLAAHPVLARMVKDGYLAREPLGIGVAPPSRRDLAVIGAPLFAALFETTAVPELRAQADAAIRGWL
ncbi:MAG: FAD/NAD(P)-binding protein [Caulobacterales bacterium]